MQIRQTTQTRIHRSLIDTWVGFFNPEVPGFKNLKVLRVTTQKFFSLGLYENISVVHDRELVCLKEQKANCGFFSITHVILANQQ